MKRRFTTLYQANRPMEIPMSIFKQHQSDFFPRAFATVAMLGPILLVLIAGTLPEGLERGQLIVSGHGAIVAILAASLVLRAVYELGYRRASELAASKPYYLVAT
jgi:hypothetical protein